MALPRILALLPWMAVGVARAEGEAPAPEPVPTVAADAPAGEAAPAPKDDEAAPRNRIVGEIVVTAQKREENLQDVPISIAAFSGEALDARGIYNVASLQKVTAGLQFGNYAGYPLIFLRGVGTDVFLPSEDPSVTTYVDGVYIPTSNGVVQSFGGIERVEVLKGPQGTLFGRNSTGGAISIVTRKPGDTFEASLQGVAGNFAERRLKGYLSTPLGSWLGLNADVIYSDVDHQYEHVDPEQHVFDEHSLAGHVRVNIHPADSFDVDLSYLEVKNRGGGASVSKNIDPSTLFETTGIEPQADNRTLESDFVGHYRAKHRLATATVTWRLPWFDAKLIGSDQLLKSYDTLLDFDGSPMPIAIFATDNQFTDAQSAELQLVSNGGWGGESLEWVVGAYYYLATAGVDPGFFQGAPGILRFLDLPPFVLDLLDLPNGVNPDNGVEFIIAGTQRTLSVSEYFQVTWKALEWLDFTVGGRYQEESRHLLKTQSDLYLTEDETLTVFRFPLENASYTNFSPKAVITVRPAEGWMLYLSGAKGFKSGTFNIVTLYAPGSYVDPEKAITFDLGSKLETDDGTLRLNAAIFHTDIEDLHASFVSLTNGGAITFENAGKARIYGAELDATWLPFASANPGFAITANGAYLHSRYTDFPDGSGFDPTTGLFRGNLDFSGNTIVRSPKWSGGLGVSQLIDLPWNGQVELAVDGYWNSGFYYDAQNSVKEDRYSLLDARVSYLHEPWNLRVTLFGHNLTDEKYHVGILQNDFGKLSTVAYPAQYGVQLNWDFGS
ncbi:MAG TPA: TonB-dependent receptor [Nevskiaceae bacterium]|nr:TonB-dependent receptor [Nevskiaceae bacterium]